MKHVLLVVTAILLLTSGMLFAQVYDDGILMVPKTKVAPTIDAVLDTAIWNQVGETVTIIEDAGDTVFPDDWFDLFGSMRLMWDDTNLYIWLEVQDDMINTGTDYNYDGVELYFDADNSKTDTAYDGLDDLQTRFNVGESTTDEIDTGYGTSAGWGFVKDGIDYVVEETDIGWALEAAIPLADLQLAPDAEFGFDAQINDADEGTREHMYRWWANDNNEWQHAHLFGTAYLTSAFTVEDGFLPVPNGAVPTIDGAMSAGEWNDARIIASNRLDRTSPIGDHVWGWEDARHWAYVKWAGDNFYYYLKVWDDYYDESFDESGTDWEFDSIELFFDGDNSKTTTYDGIDDIQIRFNLGQEGTTAIDEGYGTGANWEWNSDNVQYVVTQTDAGWDAEIAIPLGDMQLSVNSEFGFDWQLNDCDDPAETPNRTTFRWWAPSEPNWSNTTMFGTMVLMEGTAVEDQPAVVNAYTLEQNYPNPFNPTTTISYSVAKTDRVQLKVYDLLGQEVATLVNEVKPAGLYTTTFNGSEIPSGVYLYTMTTDEQTFTNKMLLVK